MEHVLSYDAIDNECMSQDCSDVFLTNEIKVIGVI